MNEIKCPHDLNQFLLGEPIFENPFPKEECEQRKFYGDCYHCFSTAIASRDHQLKNAINKISEDISQPKTSHWIDDKCSVCGKGIEDLIDSREWYRNEEPNFCPFCGLKLVESEVNK